MLSQVKAKDITDKHVADGWGDGWTWTAINADMKLCFSYVVGGRDGQWATEFMKDVVSRMYGRLHLTTEVIRPCLNVVDEAFAENIDYAQLQKIRGFRTRVTAAIIPASASAPV